MQMIEWDYFFSALCFLFVCTVHPRSAPQIANRQFVSLIVFQVIKEIAQYGAVAGTGDKGFKVVLLNEVDRLSHSAQAALRRTMEKYSANCRLILCCNSQNKVIDPVRSRCLSIRVAAPSCEQICDVLNHVAKKEQLRDPPPQLLMRIAQSSGQNLRRAVLMMEACKVDTYPFTETQEIQLPDWERFISSMADAMIRDQSPQCLLKVRGGLYELLTNCIPADEIMATLSRELIAKANDDDIRYEVAKWSAYYEHRLVLGSKEIFHLEAFAAKFMSVYKQFLVNMFA